MADMLRAAKNTDTELWRRDAGDYYSPSVFVTENGLIGMKIAGTVILHTVEDWHLLGSMSSGNSVLPCTCGIAAEGVHHGATCPRRRKALHEGGSYVR